LCGSGDSEGIGQGDECRESMGDSVDFKNSDMKKSIKTHRSSEQRKEKTGTTEGGERVPERGQTEVIHDRLLSSLKEREGEAG